MHGSAVSAACTTVSRYTRVVLPSAKPRVWPTCSRDRCTLRRASIVKLATTQRPTARHAGSLGAGLGPVVLGIAIT
ncbi:hypothetical protein GCM10009845_21300 [Pedococcus bigeumensis]